MADASMNSSFSNSGLKGQADFSSVIHASLFFKHSQSRSHPTFDHLALNHMLHCLARFGDLLAFHANPNLDNSQATGLAYVRTSMILSRLVVSAGSLRSSCRRFTGSVDGDQLFRFGTLPGVLGRCILRAAHAGHYGQERKHCD